MAQSGFQRLPGGPLYVRRCVDLEWVRGETKGHLIWPCPELSPGVDGEIQKKPLPFRLPFSVSCFPES